MKYITKQQFQSPPEAFTGETNEEPSMTVEGQYEEMKDILSRAMQRGGMLPEKRDSVYFRPEEIQQINSTYRASLDLTDIDRLKAKTESMMSQINKAAERKRKAQQELQAEMNKNQQQQQKTEE